MAEFCITYTQSKPMTNVTHTLTLIATQIRCHQNNNKNKNNKKTKQTYVSRIDY